MDQSQLGLGAQGISNMAREMRDLVEEGNTQEVLGGSHATQAGWQGGEAWCGKVITGTSECIGSRSNCPRLVRW